MPELEPLPAPHDCDERYDPACPVCREDEDDEPDGGQYGLMVVEPDGTKRDANAEEAAEWAAAIVDRGVLPAAHPAVVRARGLEPTTEPAPMPPARVIVRNVALRFVLPAAVGAFVGAFLTLPQAIVFAACLLGLWPLWKYARP